MSKEMESHLITHAAPTLAGLKSANLFRIKHNLSLKDMMCQIRSVNNELKCKGITLMALAIDEGYALLLCFRWSKLSKTLLKSETKRFLKSMGYNGNTTGKMLCELRESFFKDSFPHEIGVFLDYPLHDVECFIKCPDKKCSLCGVWKAYSNKDEAEKINTRYTHCTKIYKNVYNSGRPFSKMVVAG